MPIQQSPKCVWRAAVIETSGNHLIKFTVWGFGTSAMESMGSFSLIPAGAGSCPKSAKQPPTLQNKSREAYGYCQGNRWIFIWFVKEPETVCCVLIKRLFQGAGIVWKQRGVQHGWQRQQKQTLVRVGDEEGDTRGSLTPRYAELWKWGGKAELNVKERKGKLRTFESKRLCGGFWQGWRCLWGLEGTGWSTGGCSGGRAVSFSVQKAAPWLLLRFAPFLSPARHVVTGKTARMGPLTQDTVLSGGRGSWGCHTQQQQPSAAWASCHSHLWRAVN